jgi:glucosyl-dolichyl phosphate glucuronosyltransferase
VRIVIVVCTWNRSRLLRQVLDHMASTLRVPYGVDWELVVVNNASTDDTDAVIDAFRDRLPIRRLYEPRQGLGSARNCAVGGATGDYVLWTDDDALVAPDWVEAYCRAFRRWPEAGFFGGPIQSSFAVERPAWLVETWPLVRHAFAELDLGAQAVPLTKKRLPFGANMAFRMDVQRRFRYEPRLGNCGRVYIGGEETRVMREVLASGVEGRWVPDARVTHLIPAERQTVDYLRRYYSGRGRRYYLESPVGSVGRRGPLAWAARAVAGEMAYCVGRAIARPRLWVRGLRVASMARGALAGHDVVA